jgi:stage IV sporulation protein FB
LIKLAGITIKLHPFFVLMMMASVVTGHFLELLSLFVIVFIHELGHVTAARLFGVSVLSIEMLPFGGVAVMEDSAYLSAGKEIVIALAGPMQNVLLIVCAYFYQYIGLGEGAFLSYFIECNLIIALFNLLPILPLDGGKVSQSLFSLIAPYHATLLWSLRISIVGSLCMISYAIIPFLLGQKPPQLNLLLIGVFLLYSNWQDYRNLPYRFMRFLIRREHTYTKHWIYGSIAVPIVSHPQKPLEYILRLFRREKYHFIYVMNEQGDIVAVLPEQKVISAFLRGLPNP